MLRISLISLAQCELAIERRQKDESLWPICKMLLSLYEKKAKHTVLFSLQKLQNAFLYARNAAAAWPFFCLLYQVVHCWIHIKNVSVESQKKVF